MSGEKESLERLVERVDELLVVLNRISEDLRSLSASIKFLIKVRPMFFAKVLSYGICKSEGKGNPG